jgi:hypothetical protein
MDISLQSYFLEVKKKIFFLIGFLIVVVIVQTFYNKLRTDQYNVELKANFYDMNVLYSVIKMVNKNEVFTSETQAQNFIYEFETQIPKKMKILGGLKCEFETNILSCLAKNIQLDPANINKIENNLGSNIESILKDLFASEIKLIDDKIFSLQKLFKTLDELSKLNEEGNENTITRQDVLTLGTVDNDNSSKSLSTTTTNIKERKIANIVKIEELEYLKNTLSSFANMKNGFDYQVLVSKINLQKNTLIVFICALAFGLIIIFLTIDRKEV